MKSLRVVLDVQHMGKPHNPLDRGVIHGDLVEANLCLKYASVAHTVLTKLGHHPFLLTYDYYGQRAEFANRINADLYLACHLNSWHRPPDKNYALIEITELAGSITRQFAHYLAEIFGSRLPVSKPEVRDIPISGRGWSCINRVKAPALILEPCFINHHRSQQLLAKDIWIISDAIVYAIKTFDWGN